MTRATAAAAIVGEQIVDELVEFRRGRARLVAHRHTALVCGALWLALPTKQAPRQSLIWGRHRLRLPLALGAVHEVKESRDLPRHTIGAATSAATATAATAAATAATATTAATSRLSCARRAGGSATRWCQARLWVAKVPADAALVGCVGCVGHIGGGVGLFVSWCIAARAERRALALARGGSQHDANGGRAAGRDIDGLGPSQRNLQVMV